MARRVKQFDWSTKHGGGRPPKYPWDKWLDGSIWKLSSQRDFDCSVTSMQSLAYAQAQRWGVEVRTSVHGDQLVIQALEREAV